MNIPVPTLVIPVLNRGDLLLRAVRSIDHPVVLLLIINNGTDASVAEALATLQREPNPKVGCLNVFHCGGRNLGVAPSWNLGMRYLTSNSDWCVFMGSDIALAPGDLAKLNLAAYRNPDAGRVCANHGYSLFAVGGAARRIVGLFDENFRPAYLEDCDYDYRIGLAGLPKIEVPDCQAIHGDGTLTGSCTIHSDPVLRERNGITHGNNFDYYRRKWGGINGEEKFTQPFNDPTKPLDWWEIDAKHCQRNRIW
jgi:GT2 family glycosyltransferase